MDYKLAKELKDVGFSQWASGNTTTFFVGDPKRYSRPDKNGVVSVRYGDARVPTLEELIDACGNRFDFVQNKTMDNGGWRAISGGGQEGHGKTPTEAVAKLWLALNKK